MATRWFLPLCVLFGAFHSEAGPQEPSRPNVVWLIAEDLSAHHLELYAEQGTATPRIEALARGGVVFEHAFSNAPVCSVARTVLITGCHAPRIGAQYHRRERLVPMPEGLRTFPAYLRDAGYHTTNRHKTDYNVIPSEGTWDASSKKAHWRDRTPGQPFLHVRSFPVTHEGSLHFPAGALERSPTRTDPGTLELPPRYPDTTLFRYTLARNRDRVLRLDQEIGAVLDELEADGLLEETFVFFFADHGGVMPGTKGYANEDGLRVPMVVHVPERFTDHVPFDTGTRAGGFVEFVDLAPTVLQLAGIEIPVGLDGEAFLGEGITAEEVEARNESLGYADRFDEKSDLVRTLRSGRLRYVRRYRSHLPDALQNNYRYRMLAYEQWRELHRAGELDAIRSSFFEPGGPEELYDVVADPFQTRDLSGLPEYREELLRLRTRLHLHVSDGRDLSFIPESVLVEEAFDDPVSYGRARSERLNTLLATADIQLVSADEAGEAVERALASSDPDVRAWAWTAATAHRSDRHGIVALEARERDPVRRVRVAAAEYLALCCGEDPASTLLEALATTRSPVEANEILNVIVALRDGPDGWSIPVDPTRLRSEIRSSANVSRRLSYLATSGR